MITSKLVVLFASLVLCACTFSKIPIGSVTEKLKDEDWRGDWTNEDDGAGGATIHIRVKDAEKGVLEAEFGDAKPDDIFIRRLGDWNVASIHFDQLTPGSAKEDSDRLFVFVRLHRVGKNLIVAVSPRWDIFMRLVEERRVNGRLIKDDGKPAHSCVLEDLPESVLPLLREASGGNPFDLDQIRVYKRHP